MYNRQQAIAKINNWGGLHRPFLFIIDYEMEASLLYPLNRVPATVQYQIGKFTNSPGLAASPPPFYFNPNPMPFTIYNKGFATAMEALRYGNSYLLNLTFPTPINTNLTMAEIYQYSKARYKLWLKNRLVVFSPEPFVRIADGQISSYPMKGTIDAALPHAKEQLLANPKEQAEHATIVDLIRNDLSRVASQVQVRRYRYVEEVVTAQKTLLQVSSEITGTLPNNYHSQLGDILFTLLPAGSISGAPKKKTVEVIAHAESRKRGYFTGVVGIFDGQKLDSGVMIRFIEEKNNSLVFRSGGGITAQSNAQAEYNEMLDKVYVPFI